MQSGGAGLEEHHLPGSTYISNNVSDFTRGPTATGQRRGNEIAVNNTSGFDPNRQISRRRLLRRVGQGSLLAGTLTWVAPIVMTIDPAGAASGSNRPQTTPSSNVLDTRFSAPPSVAAETLPRTGSPSTTPLVITGGGLVAAGAAALLASDQITRDRKRAPKPESEAEPED